TGRMWEVCDESMGRHPEVKGELTVTLLMDRGSCANTRQEVHVVGERICGPKGARLAGGHLPKLQVTPVEGMGTTQEGTAIGVEDQGETGMRKGDADGITRGHIPQAGLELVRVVPAACKQGPAVRAKGCTVNIILRAEHAFRYQPKAIAGRK